MGDWTPKASCRLSPFLSLEAGDDRAAAQLFRAGSASRRAAGMRHSSASQMRKLSLRAPVPSTQTDVSPPSPAPRWPDAASSGFLSGGGCGHTHMYCRHTCRPHACAHPGGDRAPCSDFPPGPAPGSTRGDPRGREREGAEGHTRGLGEQSGSRHPQGGGFLPSPPPAPPAPPMPREHIPAPGSAAAHGKWEAVACSQAGRRRGACQARKAHTNRLLTVAALIYEAVREPGQVCKSWTIRRRAPALSPIRLSGSRPAVPLRAGSAPWRPHRADEDTKGRGAVAGPSLRTLAAEVAVPRVSLPS